MSARIFCFLQSSAIFSAQSHLSRASRCAIQIVGRDSLYGVDNDNVILSRFGGKENIFKRIGVIDIEISFSSRSFGLHALLSVHNLIALFLARKICDATIFELLNYL